MGISVVTNEIKYVRYGIIALIFIFIFVIYLGKQYSWDKSIAEIISHTNLEDRKLRNSRIETLAVDGSASWLLSCKYAIPFSPTGKVFEVADSHDIENFKDDAEPLVGGRATSISQVYSLAVHLSPRTQCHLDCSIKFTTFENGDVLFVVDKF